MAAAHAKMTGGLGVVIATSGPGAVNLTTGLMEAVLDKCSLLAITGLKPQAVLGYSEFQDVDQSRIFAGAGIEWSKDAASPNAVIPLLRDAVATALTMRTCAHLAIPVDIQAAPSPLPIRHFCASHSAVRIKVNSICEEDIKAAAETLVGTPRERRPRNVIAVGLRGIDTDHKGDMSQAILDLAESLNAPVLTRLHAKGVVDERHPLAFGVIGVHGKPGLEMAATLISTADCIISIGVQDETLLLCNSAGLQIRRLVEIQPDAICVGTRYNAEHTLLGDVEAVVRRLASCVESTMIRVEKKRAILGASDSKLPKIVRQDSSSDRGSYLCYNNPKSRHRTSASGGLELFVPKLDLLGEDEFQLLSDKLWKAMHNGAWKTLHSVIHSHGHSSNAGTCHPASVLEAYSELRVSEEMDKVSREAVVTVDVGDVTLWSSLCLILSGGSRTLYSERLGTMGYALNAAVAAVLAKPEPSGAVVLAGDGGFQMSLQELATFQQMKRPGDKLLCIIFDNELLGRVIFGFDNAGGCSLKGPDYVELAKAYGGDGVRLDNAADARSAVKQGMEAEGLFVIHVIVDPEVKADMATFKDKSLAVMNSG